MVSDIAIGSVDYARHQPDVAEKIAALEGEIFQIGSTDGGTLF